MGLTTNTILLLCLMTLAIAKPIMVTFGTHQGPIETPPVKLQKPAARTIDTRAPAPVSEETEDVPNPHVYKPPVPHQYRKNIYLQRPPATLVLGTPIDRQYSSDIQKYDILKKESGIDDLVQPVGVSYTGPHVFERQEYEILQEKRSREKQQLSYIKPHYYRQKLANYHQQQREQRQQKTVPQIGIVYLAGIRYYVPQLVYDEPKQDEEQENSVYDSKDEKYYRAKGQ